MHLGGMKLTAQRLQTFFMRLTHSCWPSRVSSLSQPCVFRRARSSRLPADPNSRSRSVRRAEQGFARHCRFTDYDCERPSAASPPWAITGQKSPQERSEEAKDLVLGILDDLESSSSLRHRRRSKRISRSRLAAVIEANPELVLGEENRCSMSHVALYLGFGLSVVIWGLALYLGVLGGATGSTAVSLAQPNCTAGLGASASLPKLDKSN